MDGMSFVRRRTIDLVLLEIAHSEKTNHSDFIIVLCFSVGKLYFLEAILMPTAIYGDFRMSK